MTPFVLSLPAGDKSVLTARLPLASSEVWLDIRRFGRHVMAFSALQQGMEIFRHHRFRGFIAFARCGGSVYVLGDPVSPPDEMSVAADVFLQAYPRTVFCQITSVFAQVLHQRGFFINGLGAEHRLYLKDFQVTWACRRGLKRWLSALTREGYALKERPRGSSGAVGRINREWIQRQKKGRELRFLARPYEEWLQEGTRTFWLVRGNAILGYAAFDPVFNGIREGELAGYVLQHLRTKVDAPHGAGDMMLTAAALRLRDDGVPFLSLGLSPLYGLIDHRFRASSPTDRLIRVLAKTQRFYRFQTLGEHKDRYRATHIPTFIAVNKVFPLFRLLGMMKLNGLL